MDLDAQDLNLEEKFTFHIRERKLVLQKRPFETRFHVFAKALAYALYSPRYPDVVVEPRPLGRYRPDLVELDADQLPVFWAECGKTKRDKIAALTNRYRQTHFAFIKRPAEVRAFAKILRAQIHSRYAGTLELITFPYEAFESVDDYREVDLTQLAPPVELIHSSEK